jgi:hypothetical protein
MIPTLIIDGQNIHFGKVWVHLQRPKSAHTVHYSVQFDLNDAPEILGPRKPPWLPWSDHVWKEIKSFGGTFMVEGYFRSMTSLAAHQRDSCEWVIATLDEIVEERGVIRLSGKAIPFNRELAPELKTLE